MNARLRAQLEGHIPALRRYAWALTRRAEDADDLVQDCLERALARLGSYRSDGELRSWLFSILHNVFVSACRRDARRRNVDLDEAADVPINGTQEAHAGMRDVFDALHELPEDQRAVLLLVGVEDLSYEEAAKALDLPVGTVMSRLSRGRERLRRVLEQRPAERLRIVR